MKLLYKNTVIKLLFFVAGVLCLAIFSLLFEVKLQSIPRWSIGTYFIDNQFNLSDFGDNPIFTAADFRGKEAMFVADPFVFGDSDSLYMFYEVGVKRSRTGWGGDIALATSSNGTDWNDRGIVLSDKVTLAFPNVFKSNDEYYMTVDSYEAENLRLFTATNFPSQWVCTDTLLYGSWNDPVLIESDSIFYLFTSLRGTNSLHLFFSNSISGPYIEHHASPIIKNNKGTHRNAGRIFSLRNRWYRPVQDCTEMYGETVRIMKIDTLNEHEYLETEIKHSPILSGSGSGWNKKKMHTFNLVETPKQELFVITDGTPVNYERRLRVFFRAHILKMFFG